MRGGAIGHLDLLDSEERAVGGELPIRPRIDQRHDRVALLVLGQLDDRHQLQATRRREISVSVSSLSCTAAERQV